MQKVNVVIVIVNYNSYEDVFLCVESIKRSNTRYSYSIIVVDNCSTDDSTFELAKPTRDFLFISANENNGYCAGNNQGIRFAEKHYEFDYIWILNPDTEVKDDAIENLLSFAFQSKSYGLIGATLIYHFDKDTIQAIGGGKIGFSKKMNFQILPPYFHNQKFSEKKDTIPDFIECKSIVGAALLISKDVFDKIGYFEESYFLYSDETEFCIRLYKKTKLKLAALKNVIVYHKEGSQKKDRKLITNYYLTRNWLYNVKKYYPLLLPYVFFYHCIYLAKIKLQKKNELFYYTLYALKDFMVNKRGKYSHQLFEHN